MSRRRVTAALILALGLLGCTEQGAWDLFKYLDGYESDIFSGLVARYTFDNAGTPGSDDSGNGHHGTPTNGPVWVNDPSRGGGVLRFDGIDDHVALPTIATGMTEITITAWVNLAHLDAWEPIFNVTGWSVGWLHFQIVHVGAELGRLRMSVSGNSPQDVNAALVFDAGDYGRWFHVAAVYSSVTRIATLYIDGVVEASEAPLPAIPAEIEAGKLGGWIGTPSRWLEGSLDDVRFYNRALSVAEIGTIYTVTR